MFNQHRDYDLKDSATFEQRIIAYVVDATLCGVIAGFLAPLSGALAAVTPLLYFLIGHLALGYTLGKYLLGLRVISTTGDSSIARMLIRESIGKWLSGALLLIGYLMVIFRSDRKAMHDILSATRVITLKPQNVTGFSQVARGLGSVVALTFIFCSILVYQIFYTPMILNQFAARLAPYGLEMQGVSGSYMTGFKIKNMLFENEDLKFNFNNIQFRMNRDLGLLERMSVKEATIDYFHIDSGSFELLNLDKDSFKDLIKRKEKSNKKKKKKKTRKRLEASRTKEKKFDKFHIKSVEIGNLIFKKGLKEFKINRFSIKDMIGVRGGRNEFKHIFFDSSLGQIYLKDTYFDEKAKNSKISFSGFLKKDNPLISGLRTDFDFNGILNQNQGEKEMDLFFARKRISFSFFENVDKKKDMKLKIKDFSPRQFFDAHIPLSRINLAGDMNGLSGSLKVRNKMVSFSKHSMIDLLTTGLTGYTTKNQMINMNFMQMKANQPWLSVSLNADQQADLSSDVLSQLYANRNYHEMSTKSRAVITKDLNFFSANPFMKLLNAFGPDERSPASNDGQ